MNMENNTQTTDNNIANIVNNIDSSSSTINPDTSSHGLPEVTPAPRHTIPRGLKATLQEQEIARLQAQCTTRQRVRRTRHWGVENPTTRQRTRTCPHTTSSLWDHDTTILTCPRFSRGASLYQFYDGGENSTNAGWKSKTRQRITGSYCQRLVRSGEFNAPS